MSFKVLALLTKSPAFSKEVKSHVCLSDFVNLPSRLQLIGPGWAPDPLRVNQIFFWKFGLGSVTPRFLSLDMAGIEGHDIGTIGGPTSGKAKKTYSERWKGKNDQ